MSKDKQSSLRTIIHQVTAEKLHKLKAQKDVLNTHFGPILKTTDHGNPLQKLKDLQTSLKDSPIKDSENTDLDNQLKDLDILIQLAEKDVASGAGTCDQTIQHWIRKLTDQINFILQRCDYSYLYGSIMTEYLDVKKDKAGETTELDEPQINDPEDTKEATMKELTDRIFVPSDLDKQKFQDFLSNNVFKFDDYEDQKFMESKKKATVNLAKSLAETSIPIEDLKHCIKGLYSIDLLNEEKKSTLRELEQNSVALEELATLLTDYLANFSTWNWPHPVPIDFRRNMAGKYRAFMDEDIITALFLQYIGVRWAVHFKDIFLNIYNNESVWKRQTPHDLKPKRGSRKVKGNTIDDCRRNIHQQSFLAVLPTSMKDQYSSYDSAEEGPQNEHKDSKAPMNVKQRLLHVISNEIHLNKVIRPNSPITVVQTDMEWFGPSLSHDAMLVLMEVLGVPTEWLKFFERFLQAPLIVESGSEPKTRKRGVAISHMLSTLFGESLLFAMDFYVNRQSGILLHRIHDDFWFWNHKEDKTAQAWRAIEEYAGISGLKLNMDKSGSVTIPSSGGSENPKKATFGKSPLPHKEIKWGFLQLCSDGIFRISKDNLKPHIEEMSRIINQSQTVLEWVNTYNKFMAFFIRNFGDCALTLGTQHVDQIVMAVQLINSEVFKSTNGSPVRALQSKFEDLARTDLLDAWIYWPVADGGLGLKNHLLNLLALMKTYKKLDEDSRFTLLPEKDKSVWKSLLQQSEQRRSKAKFSKRSVIHEGPAETVTDSEFSECEEDTDDGVVKKRKARQISFEGVCRKYREYRWSHWYSKYDALLKSPNGTAPEAGTSGSSDQNMWLHALYGPRLVEYFGTEDFINTKLIPASLISIMQASRVKY